VLVAGGQSSDASSTTTPITSTELYDPETGAWEVTDGLTQARFGHTATRLNDGRVLVVGGYHQGESVATTEIYDPATGMWSATGNLITDRAGHTATLLPNGKVLVVGGQWPVLMSGPIIHSSVELYDPATGTWSEGASMEVARHDHTATLLPNGQVLVAGGDIYNGDPLAESELYNPTTNDWQPADRLNEARYAHEAVVLTSGEVLAIGGSTQTNAGAFLNSTEVYSATTNSWTLVGDMATGRGSGHTATVLPDGRVLVTGGAGYGDCPGLPCAYASAELFHPTTREWQPAYDLTLPRWGHTATLLDDSTVLIVGGATTNNEPVASVERYQVP
jgi:hypothetical protein